MFPLVPEVLELEVDFPTFADFLQVYFASIQTVPLLFLMLPLPSSLMQLHHPHTTVYQLSPYEPPFPMRY
jgi:hypothetical protein